MNGHSTQRVMLIGLLAFSAAALAANQGDDVQPAVQTSAGTWATRSGGATQTPPPAGTRAADADSRPSAAPASTGPAPEPAAGPAAQAAPKAGTHRTARQAHAQAGPTHGGSTGAARRADSIQLGTTQISGNSELPKLMYIVPWQRPQIGTLQGRPPNSLVDQALTPVDRAVFERQNRYYAALEAATGPPAAAAQAAARPAGRQDEK